MRDVNTTKYDYRNLEANIFIILKPILDRILVETAAINSAIKIKKAQNSSGAIDLEKTMDLVRIQTESLSRIESLMLDIKTVASTDVGKCYER